MLESHFPLPAQLNVVILNGCATGAALKERGTLAFTAGGVKEALMYYRAALLYEPQEKALHSNVATCLKKLGLHAAAAMAARHCTRLAPDWPKVKHVI